MATTRNAVTSDHGTLRDWVLGRPDIPPRYDPEEAARLAAAMLTDLEAALADRRADRFHDAHGRLEMLGVWHLMANPRSDDGERASRRLEVSVQRMLERHAGVLRKWAETDQVIRAILNEEAAISVPRPSRRAFERAILGAQQNVVLTPEEVRALPPPLRHRAKAAARRTTIQGSGSDRGGADPNLAYELLWSDAPAIIRHKAWRSLFEIRLAPRHLNAILRHRRASARRRGAQNLMALHTESLCVPVGYVMRSLWRSGTHLAPAFRACWRTLGIDPASPPDLDRLAGAMMDRLATPSDTPPPGAIPESHLPTIMTDLVRAAGWHVRAIRREVHGILRLSVDRPGADRGELLMQIGRTAIAGQAGYCAGLVSPYQARIRHERPQVLMVVGRPDNPADGCDVGFLRLVAHELGHALHALAAPPDQAGSMDTTFPNDLLELPALLMEYAVTPARLARWAIAAPIAWRHPDAWRDAMDRDMETPHLAMELQKQQAAALCNLLASHHQSFDRIRLAVRRVRKAFALNDAGDGKEWATQAIISTAPPTPGLGHGYWWPENMVVALLGPRPWRKDGARLYRQLTEQVLSRAATPKQVARRWREWRGETVQQSAHRGAAARVRFARLILARLARQAGIMELAHAAAEPPPRVAVASTLDDPKKTITAHAHRPSRTH